MLPAAARLTRRDEFTTVVRRGRRAGRTLVVVHVLLASTANTGPGVDRAIGTRVGFIVSKAVGGSVVRHRVARRLRHRMRDRLSAVPDGTRIVVRALPASAHADSAELAQDLDSALRAALSTRSSPRSAASSGSGRR